MRLYRVFPWDPDAAAGEWGHPLHVPPGRGRSRIDNLGRYDVLYASDAAAGAVAETFAHHWIWSDDMFVVPGRPGGRRALAEFDAAVTLVDLDEPTTLLERGLRPSAVASSQREVTRAWALDVFEGGGFDGIRWWSVKDSRWGTTGVWTIDRVAVVNVTQLDRTHPAVREAGNVLIRPWDTAA